MTAELASLVELAVLVGSDPRHVQGGGGNLSLKRDDELWVKASGTWLARAANEEAFVLLPLSVARTHARHAGFAAHLANLHPPTLRPSIEAPMHALMPHPVVLHVHSVNAIAWASRRDAVAQLTSRLGGLAWGWVPYRRPGTELANGVADVLSAHEGQLDLLVLGNHGLLLGADSCQAAFALLVDVDQRLAIAPRPYPACNEALVDAVNDRGWRSAADPRLHAVATDPVTLAVAARGTLYPDHAVFLGERALVVPDGGALSSALDGCPAGGAPCYALVPAAGVLLAPDVAAGAIAMLGCLADVGARVDDVEALAFLGHDEVSALHGWESEAYRRSRDPAPEASCR